jgi:hypothetical protein
MELPKFKKEYKINNKKIEVQVNIYQNNLGCYIAILEHKLIKNGYITIKKNSLKKSEFPLNSLRRSKLERKITRFLYSFYK